MLFATNYESMYENIVHNTYLYMTMHNLDSMIIGMSGGIDSTLCAALAYEAKKRISHKVKLIGRSLPIYSKEDEMRRAENSGRIFCDDFEVYDLTDMYGSLRGIIEGSKDKSIREGNLKARLRMIKLFDLARANNGLVLSTDNWTEFLLGFWTLHGDVGNFGMIQELWKTEVYGLSNYISDKYDKEGDFIRTVIMKDAIAAVPTDGLGITDSDFDQLYPGYNRGDDPQYTYKKIDLALMGQKGEYSDSYVWKRKENTAFKRSDPYNISRQLILRDTRK